MKKRTFFVMLILFLVFLNSMILIVSVVILNDKCSTARDRYLAEHYVIASSLLKDMQGLDQRGYYVRENIEKLMSSYARYLQGKGSGLAVAYCGEWIYKSTELMPKENLAVLPDTGGGQERIVYMENEPSPVLYVYGSFPVPWEEYGLMYIGNLNDVAISWRQTKDALFLMGGVMMLIMALFLFHFLNIIFLPLRQISGASTKIAHGNYGSRLSVQGKDEIASVAYNFNLMAEQVENQILCLKDIAERKQQFIDNFSHELRIPLTAIYGYAEYIQKALISEEERYECTSFIMSECDRLQNMAYQLLEIAMLRHDEVEKEDCSIREIFSLSEKVMHVRAAERGIKLSYEMEQNLYIRANMQQILILINNLIDNAIKASQPEGEVLISVRLGEEGYSEEKDIVVEIEDHGVGMEPEQVPHIKEAFYRIDKARSRAVGGTGLGLSICDRIAQLHHADLTFISEQGKGTIGRLCFHR